MINLDKQTLDEWNELGFYYEHEDNLKQWRFYGSKLGLSKLSSIICSYASNSTHEGISEHIHVGLYNYLKIMTWNESIINDKYIAGSLKELLRLSTIIYEKVTSTDIGQIGKISIEYSNTSTSNILLVVMADDFIPSSIEFDY